MDFQLTYCKEKKAMRKLYSLTFAAIVTLTMLVASAGTSFAQLFNYTPYPFTSLNQEDYYPDSRYLVPDLLPGGERIFLVPVFVYNTVDVSKNPNTFGNVQKPENARIFGVDGQFLEPIRSFEIQVQYANQAITLDETPGRGSPIVTVGPTLTDKAAKSWAEPFYITYTEQSDNDTTNPYLRRIRIAGASEVPLPLSSNVDATPDSTDILFWIRFRIVPNWVVNATILQLDSVRYAGHPGDPQYDPFNWFRGNLAGHAQEFRGRLRVEITQQPAFELRPASFFITNDEKNFELVPTLISDQAIPAASVPFVQVQLRDKVGNTRLTNIDIVTDQSWLKVGLTAGGGQPSIFIPKIDYTGSAGSEERNLFIFGDDAGLLPGIYYGYVTLTSDGASNSPARILVRFIVRARPDEPNDNAGSGIRLTLTNSCNPRCSNMLVFGTGEGATDGIDALFGEDIFTQSQRTAIENSADPNQRCWAHFEPRNMNADIRFQDPDFAGTLRDIRSDLSDTTILYKVVFSAGNPLCYPVTVCVDPTDFPDGARIIARDTLNGSIFSYNLRDVTLLGGGMRCFTIQDPNINSFIIEYTRGSEGVLATLLTNNWNFISLPVIPPDNRASTIFSNATGSPFAYASFGGWEPKLNLEFGRGYMVHYGNFIGGNNLVAGVRSRIIRDVRLNAGWNAVGAASDIACADRDIFFTPIGSLPVPVLQSEVFDFTATKGYNTVAYLTPGVGYFLKVSEEGYYNVTASGGGCKAMVSRDADVKAMPMVTVRDAAQNGQQLFFGVAGTEASHYEMPPSMRAFDARFAGNTYVSASSDKHTINFTSENYPVALAFENLQGSVEVRDQLGNLIGTASGNGSVVVSDANVKTVVVAYKQSAGGNVAGFALEQNFPNPFADATMISYAVPAETFVTITVTNALGQEVASLVNGTVAAGSHKVTFDAANLASGTYYYTMRAGSFVKTEKLTIQ
jgi:hypothetical protein